MALPLPRMVEPVPNPPMPFDSNGAGDAIADLDGDGWLDVVLGGLHGAAKVLWNRGGPGGLAFDAVALELPGARAVGIVDEGFTIERAAQILFDAPAAGAA